MFAFNQNWNMWRNVSTVNVPDINFYENVFGGSWIVTYRWTKRQTWWSVSGPANPWRWRCCVPSKYWNMLNYLQHSVTAQNTRLFRHGEANRCSFTTFQRECAKICLKIKTKCVCLLLLNSILHRLPMKGSTSASVAPQMSVLPPSVKPVKSEIHVPEGRLYVIPMTLLSCIFLALVMAVYFLM